jgi:putative restriction endonuclease
VLQAYETRCALCQLRHGELLDAAHILPDTHPSGRPVVPNGLSLCRFTTPAMTRRFWVSVRICMWKCVRTS